MEHSILISNQSRRLELPLWLLICFSMFCVWQMGFIYFMNSSLTLEVGIPLPVNMDNVTALIAVGYVLAIILMTVLPHFVVWAARITTAAALLSVIGLFLPISAQSLTLLLYIQTFCCCFMIGFETFTISNLFSERSTILHLTVAYAVALFLIAVVQNDLFPVTFSAFRLMTLVMLVMLLVFFCRLPAGKNACPRYVKKGDGLRYPRRLFSGIILYSFVADIMMIGGPAAAAEVPNGVLIAYMASAAGSLLLYVLYKKARLHPMNAAPVLMGLSAIGFLLMFLASGKIPFLAYPACILVGLGFIPCLLMPLYGMTLMKGYPSRLIAPSIMFIALITVLVHSSLVAAFRTAAELNLAYLVITVICIVIYWQLAPYLLHIFQRKLPSAADAAGAAAKETAAVSEESVTVSADTAAPETILLSRLTPRELEVLNLISSGYSNRDIAGILIISEHTVNDYTKKIYRKLDVHSRHAAAQVINRYQRPIKYVQETKN